MSESAQASCHVCAMLASPDSLIWRDQHWSVLSVADAPGLAMICRNDHDEGLATLPPAAAAGLGGLIQTLSAGLLQTQTADRVALVHLTDRARHTHLLLVARDGGGEPIGDLAGLERRVKATRDPDAARAITESLRAALSGG